MKKKWKYLRDQFATEVSKLKPPRSGDEGGEIQASKWLHFKSLYFLRNIIKCRASCGNLSRSVTGKDQETSDNYKIIFSILDGSDEKENEIVGDEQIDVGDKDFEEESVLAVSQPDPSTLQDMLTNSASPSPVPKMQKMKRMRRDDYTASMIEIEKKKLDILERKNENKALNEDEDLLFFKSILPHVKKICPNRKLAFRGKIQEVVQEFAYPMNHLQPLQSMRSTTPYSSSSSTLPTEIDTFVSGGFTYDNDNFYNT